jgi:hypothetical protein
MPSPLPFVEIHPTFPQRDPSLIVIEIFPIKLEKLHHENSKVFIRVDFSSPDFRMHLQKADRKANDAVAPKAACVHFVHTALAQKGLGHHNQTPQRLALAPIRTWEHIFQESADNFARNETVPLVDADINLESSMGGHEFDNRDLGFGYDGDM